MNRDRLLDLMAARATEGLDSDELRELDPMLAAQDEFSEEELELAAAAADLAIQRRAGGADALPSDLRARIMTQSAEFVGRAKPAATPDVVPFPSREAGETKSDKGFNPMTWLGWAVAAALALAFVPWPIGGPDTPADDPAVIADVTPPAPPTAAEERQSLLDRADDAITVAWAPPTVEGYEEVTGDVVWSDAEQRGYMRLKGLPAIADSDDQYQLWIVDPEVDTHPVDGGVFDMPVGAGEAVIPIDSKLAVDNPAVFAITREKKGGVVVSAGPLLVIAAVEA